MQIKTTRKTITHPLRMAKIKKTKQLTIPSTGEYAEQLEVSCIVSRIVK